MGKNSPFDCGDTRPGLVFVMQRHRLTAELSAWNEFNGRITKVAFSTRPTALLATAALLAGCASKAGAPDASPLAVYGNLQTLEVAPVLVAAEYIYEPKTDVKLGGIPNLVGEKSLWGDGAENPADIATHAETQGLRYSVHHPNVRIILTVAEGYYRIVARKSAGISRLEDLKGKRVATFPNGSSHYFLHKMMQSVGLTAEDLEIVAIRPLSAMPAALASGKVDAVAIWEPESENAAHLIGDDLIEFHDKSVYRELFNLNSTAEILADPAKRKQIVAFVRAVIEASEMIATDPDIAISLVADASGFDEELVSRAWRHQGYPATLPADLLDVLEEEERWLAEAEGRRARTRNELSTLIDDSILKEALALP